MECHSPDDANKVSIVSTGMSPISVATAMGYSQKAVVFVSGLGVAQKAVRRDPAQFASLDVSEAVAKFCDFLGHGWDHIHCHGRGHAGHGPWLAGLGTQILRSA